MYSSRNPAPAHPPALRSARLLYGSGMRLMEAIRLRVKDVGFDRIAAPA